MVYIFLVNSWYTWEGERLR